MSMSQEEIEALMSGLDIEEDTSSPDEVVENVKVNTQEIEELLSQTENVNISENKSSSDEIPASENIEEKSLDKSVDDEFISNDDISDLFNGLDESNFFEETSTPEPVKEDSKPIVDEKKTRSEDEIVNDWTTSQISQGIFPFPADKDTKVVNQLSQVANDSEEKVSQIFDVLSLTLDNNNELRKQIKEIEDFVSLQSNLLLSLNSKFPNIKVFDQHLTNAKKLNETLNGLKSLTNNEDSQIFQAMELMQFNDINRQKIERVMSVIRKLSLYLNNLFEDDGASKEIVVAKHIHGDSNNDLIGDDLDKLIMEFSNNKE